jgi:hypothetical protein
MFWTRMLGEVSQSRHRSPTASFRRYWKSWRKVLVQRASDKARYPLKVLGKYLHRIRRSGLVSTHMDTLIAIFSRMETWKVGDLGLSVRGNAPHNATVEFNVINRRLSGDEMAFMRSSASSAVSCPIDSMRTWSYCAGQK